jgi:hypothetical protein
MKATVKRNAMIVGNNSKSYNDKHPENPVSLRPIHDAVKKTPKILDEKMRLVPDVARINYLYSLHALPRLDIDAMVR